MKIQYYIATSLSILFTKRCSAQPIANGAMKVSSLSFTSIDNRPSVLSFGIGSNAVRIANTADGLCFASEGQNFMTFQPATGYLSLEASQVQMNSQLNVQGGLLVNGFPQWQLAVAENFESTLSKGWDNPRLDLITQCAGVSMLGGYGKFSKGEITKDFELPPHDFLRVKAIFHFIDSWVGETGFMRMNIGRDGSMVYVWTDSHKAATEEFSVNVCGGDTGDTKFSVPIDVTVAHTAPSVTLGFGSTIELDNPFEESWGISGLEIYTRSA